MRDIRSIKVSISILSMLFILSQAYGQDITEDDSELSQVIYDYSYKGWYNVFYNINLDSAEYYLLKALDLQYSTYEILEDKVANNHILISSVYRQFHNNTEALLHLNKAEEILDVFDPNNILYGSLYHNKGNIIKSQNDVYRTKEYYENSFKHDLWGSCKYKSFVWKVKGFRDDFTGSRFLPF